LLDDPFGFLLTLIVILRFAILSEGQTMWKPILAGTTALVIAGSTYVYAQNRQNNGARRWQPNIEDMRAYGDARIAALKAGLALSAEQEKNWPAFEQAARDFQKLRLDRLSAGVEARRNGQPRTTSDPVERMDRRATAMAETGAALKKLADASKPLYSSLDDNQKRRFTVLSRMGRDGRDDSERGGRMHRWMHDGGPRGSRRTENQDTEHGPMPRALGLQRSLMAPIQGEEKL
jgi:zinc resistance-associated protein